MLTIPAEQGARQPGPDPVGPKQGRSGGRKEIQRRVEITQGSVKISDRFVVMRQV